MKNVSMNAAFIRTGIHIMVLVIAQWCGTGTYGQSLEQKWLLYTNSLVDFTAGAPVLGNPPPYASDYYNYAPGNLYPGPELGYVQSAADEQGNLQFFIKFLNNTNSSYINNGAKIYDKNGVGMPHGNLKAYQQDACNKQLIIPRPGHLQQYYVFYSLNGGLFYSLVDMALNNGTGDVVDSIKDKMISGYSTVNGLRIIGVTGCDCIWLLAQASSTDKILSFRIDSIAVSTANTAFNRNWALAQTQLVNGEINTSQDGMLVAQGTGKGIECYTFEKCSGRLKLTGRLDTNNSFWGVCFSPDNSKLYASQTSSYYRGGQVYQYDLNAGDMEAIQASKTLVLQNPGTLGYNPFLGCYCDTMITWIGTLKSGPDNRIYMSNNVLRSDYSDIPMPGYSNNTVNHGLHVIQNPDEAGNACNPQLNVIDSLWTPFYCMTGRNYLIMLPPAIPSRPLNVDTVTGHTTVTEVCFRNQHLLKAPSDAHCPVWDNGSTDTVRSVNSSGTYTLGYFKGCAYQTDTYSVSFIPMPDYLPLVYGCPGQIMMDLSQYNGYEYAFVLIRMDGDTVRYGAGSSVKFDRLNAGDYRLRIMAGNSCDTIVPVVLKDYPVPVITVTPEESTISYGDSITLQANGATYYWWSPAADLNMSALPAVISFPKITTRYTVKGMNDYGCVDSAHAMVYVDGNMKISVPNAFSPNGDGINDVFRILAAGPFHLISFQVYNRYGQQVFETGNRDIGWNGTMNGRQCATGTYYYLIDYEAGATGSGQQSQRRTLKGEVTLLR